MDLRTEAVRLKLDLLAVEIGNAFDADGVPYAVIKGPSTSLWLYDPPRMYRDVDLLVPRSMVTQATAALVSRGLCSALGRPGEEAPHSLLLRSTEGYEIDVHFTMPTLPPHGDRVWEAFATHLETMDVGVGSIRVLDTPARCVVLALHALNNGPFQNQSLEDLSRAWAQEPEAVWGDARALADRIGAVDLFLAGLSLVDPQAAVPSARANLYLLGAPPAAFGLQRFEKLSPREFSVMIFRELFPSREFMRYANPGIRPGMLPLMGAHLRRWARLARQLPRAVALLRQAHRTVEPTQIMHNRGADIQR
jgi:hypothetical protein